MGRDLERFAYRAEDFLRRNLRSKAAREAQKRRARRKFEAFLRRLRRAGFVLLGLLAALIFYRLAIAPLGLLWLLLLPAIFFAAFMSLFLPLRRRAADPAAPERDAVDALPLDALARETEDWLVDRCRELPGRALPHADTICQRLDELQPCLARLDPLDPLTNDARRLIGRHLPHLIEAWLSLPPSRRTPESEATRRLAEGLATVSEELARLQEQASRDRFDRFETQSRFIETRYRDPDRLGGS
jgi:hypothetical protein